MSNQEISENTDSIDITDGLTFASYLHTGDRFCFQAQEEGVTREELAELESFSSRITIDSASPIPIYIDIQNDKGKEILSIFRFSQTLNQSENLYQISKDDQGNIQTDSKITEDKLPIVKKLVGQLKSEVGKKVKTDPNYFLIPTIYSTNDEDIKWKELLSPKLIDIPAETDQQPYRRLYVNVDFNRTDYRYFVDELCNICKIYNKPLIFKYIHSGKNSFNSIMDPYDTKIVFYFGNSEIGKRNGESFAQFLSSTTLFAKSPVGRQKEKGFDGSEETFANDKLLFALGTKESRTPDEYNWNKPSLIT